MEGGLLKCKNCGGLNDISKAVNGVIECEYCFGKFTVPKKDVSPAALSFLRQGEHDLDTCKFDDAYAAYSKAAEYDRNEPEAYWGMALAEFKVQYIRDTVRNLLQPICHEFTEKQFKENKNYLNALKYATDIQKEEYEKKAQEIDYIHGEFLKLKESGLHFDAFICVKVSRIDEEQVDNSQKNWTEDAYDADAIYDLLKRNGFSPFFSEREIRGRTGADYEAMILYALCTSETMLVVCRNEEYLNTPWVKNEFTRFKELVNNKEKENDALTIVYHKYPIERLPGNNHGRIQGIDYSRREADLEIIKFVENHTPLAKAKREEERRKREAQTEEFKKQIELQQQAQKSLEEKLKNLNPNSATGTSSTVDTLLTRANQEMDVKNFTRADKYYDTVLERAPENAYAWWGKFLCEFKCTTEKTILNNSDDQIIKNVLQSKNMKFAFKYADGEIAQRIQNFKDEYKLKLNKELENINSNIEGAEIYKKNLKQEAEVKSEELKSYISRVEPEFRYWERKESESKSKYEKVQVWDYDGFYFWMAWLIIGILIAVGLTIMQMIAAFNWTKYTEIIPSWLIWGCNFIFSPAEAIAEGGFGSVIISPILAFIGSVIEGVIYGAIASMGICLVVTFFYKAVLHFQERKEERLEARYKAISAKKQVHEENFNALNSQLDEMLKDVANKCNIASKDIKTMTERKTLRENLIRIL